MLQRTTCPALAFYWVKQQCDTDKVAQRDFRFSRRDIREATGWGNTQIRVHMDRLVDMEYAIVHRGGRGQTFTYELVYAGHGEHGESFISGLITPTLTNNDNLAGLDSQLAGSKRPQNGAKTEGLRGDKNGCKPDDNWDIEELIAEEVKKDLLEASQKVSSGERVCP